MSKLAKLLLQILRGTSDANIRFEDLCNLLIRLGFEVTTCFERQVWRKNQPPEGWKQGKAVPSASGQEYNSQVQVGR